MMLNVKYSKFCVPTIGILLYANSLLCNIKILQNVDFYQRQVGHQEFEIGPFAAHALILPTPTVR